MTTTPTPTHPWVNGRTAALLAVLTAAASALNVADGDWLAAAGFGLFAVEMGIKALDDLRWHGRHEPWTGRAQRWIGPVVILIALLLLAELLLAT